MFVLHGENGYDASWASYKNSLTDLHHISETPQEGNNEMKTFRLVWENNGDHCDASVATETEAREAMAALTIEPGYVAHVFDECGFLIARRDMPYAEATAA